jgi:transaldolase
MSKLTTLRTARLYGQSIWYDNIRRGLIQSGELENLIELGVLGITSNPTIFEKAISGSHDYDEALQPLVKAGKSAGEIYEELALDDIRAACDLLLPVFDATDGVDGRVSWEVLPSLASDTAQTIAEGKRLAKLVGRRNIMIKVPGTPAGIPAVRVLTAAGISVNVTLVFSLDQYRQVLAAYSEGLIDRSRTGESFEGLCSVASFFVSRVDSSCDKLLEATMANAREEDQGAAKALLGKIAIANAKLAYEIYEESLVSPAWKSLAAQGARPQRLLWASTGTKNPSYPDTMYLDALVGPDTVNTVPPATLEAFLDHGQPSPTLRTGLSEAKAQVRTLANLGLDLNQICVDLLTDGVKSFSASMTGLLAAIEARRAAVSEILALEKV